MGNTLIATKQSDWALIQNIAPIAAASRMFGVTEQQAAIVMLKGHELGLGLAVSFEFIHVINSKPSVSPKGCLALIHQSGELAGLKIEDKADQNGPTRCVVTMKRINGFEYTTTFSMEDARKAQLVKADSNWEKYPANMLRWRAIGYCADVVFPDVIGGLYRPEELGAEVDATGEPITPYEITNVSASPTDETVVTITATPTFTFAPETVPSVTLADLIEQGWSAEQIVVANEGTIPETSEDCQRVKEKLEAENVPS